MDFIISFQARCPYTGPEGFFYFMADKISGYHLTRQWFNFCQATDQNIKPIHTAIYMYTIHLCNSLKWKPVFQLPTSETMKVLGISNYTTYRVALEEIISFGFIKMVEKSRNQYTANRICLVQNRSSTVLSTVSGTVLSTVSKVKQLKHNPHAKTPRRTRPDLNLSPLEDLSSLRGLRLKCGHAVRTEISTVCSRRLF